MRYIGSKTWCLEKLLQLVLREVPNAKSLCDPFAGTCTVARFFKLNRFRVTTGDLLSLSYAFQVAGVCLNKPLMFKKLLRHLGHAPDINQALQTVLSHLNDLPRHAGWVTRNYSLAGTARRKFFTVSNAEHLDAILLAIKKWSRTGLICRTERWYLLACTLEAADRVANTAGTYYAYLNTFYRKARRPLAIRPIEVFNNGYRNVVRCADAEKTVRSTATDVLYLDPPYNQRDYGAYYHLPDLLVSGQTPRVTGRSGRPRQPTNRSPFCSKSTARDALNRVLQTADARLIILHYAEQGIIQHQDILTMMRELGPTYSLIWKSRAYTSSPTSPKLPQFRTRLYVCHPT